MDHLHKALVKTNKSYASWHKNDLHILTHWTVLLFVALFCSSNLINALSVSAQSDIGTNNQNLKQTISVENKPGKTIRTIPLSKANKDPESLEEVLVKFKTNVGQDKKTEVLAKHNLNEKAEIAKIGVKILSVDPNDTADEVAQNLKYSDSDSVEFAEPNQLYEPAAIANDTYYSSAWHLTKIEANRAWDTTMGGGIVAVLDSGVDCSNPDLSFNCYNGWNFIDNNSNISDVTGHGTPVAGIIAAVTNNSIGVAAISGGSKIMPLRVSDNKGFAIASAVANALVYAADHGAKVANISYGGVAKSSSINTAAQYFISKGGVITTSAGNESAFDSTTDNPNFLHISATTQNDTLASWSNTGNNVDLAAPGDSIVTTASTGPNRAYDYGYFAGTSASAPVVAAIASLVISTNPSLTSAQIQTIIKNSADDLGPVGWDPQYGYGRVNAYKAVSLATQSPSPIPTTQPSPTTSPSPSPSPTDSPSPTPVTVSITSYRVIKTGDSAVISWTTNIPSSGFVNYGTTSKFGMQVNDAAMSTTHSLTLTNLNKSTKYYYQIVTMDSKTTAIVGSNFRTTNK